MNNNAYDVFMMLFVAGAYDIDLGFHSGWPASKCKPLRRFPFFRLAFRRGLGLGVGFKVQVRFIKKEHALSYGVYGLRRACV